MMKIGAVVVGVASARPEEETLAAALVIAIDPRGWAPWALPHLGDPQDCPKSFLVVPEPHLEVQR